ncbi:phosphate ABC transporter permease subunit PstC [Desulfurivibrio sp. D14AmB]|uniref:phosphate ABC transporter permease subunit PstC n=1 Tax=Desulfurivibrio sp. D14AmB TaxID=3374370 RepID=UPI00376EBDBB
MRNPDLQANPSASELIRRTPPLLYRWLGDRIFALLVTMFGLLLMGLAISLAVVLYREGEAAITTFGFFGFLTGTSWDPAITLSFGTLPFLIGTIVTSVAALVLSFLPAIAVAIFSAEYAPRWLAHLIDAMVDLIAAVPSVVVGIWGIFVFAPWMRERFYMPIYLWAAENQPDLLPILGSPIGYGMTTATIVLALMIVPFTAALSRDAIRLVPASQREAAWALGATRWEVIRMAVLPYARGGIIAGAILSFGRAIGETMAVAMLIGNKNTLPFNLFGPAATMPSVIINEFREAVENLHLASLMAIGFYLFLISLIVNLVAAYIQRKMMVSGGRSV